jgi:arylsulfatase A-like enzyme
MPLAREAWALALGALALEGLGRAISPGSELASLAAVATLFALQLRVQLCAALYLWPVRALLTARSRAVRAAAPVYALLVASAVLYPASRALTSGEWISAQAYAGALRVSLAAAGAAVIALLAWVSFGPAMRLRARVRVLLALALLALAAAATWAHVQLYPGQYPEAHLVLLGVAALCAHIALCHVLDALAASSAHGATVLRFSAVPLWAALLALTFSQLPPRRVVAAQLVLGSTRSGPLLALFPARAATELLDALRAVDMRQPYRPPPAPASGFALPPDTNIVLVVIDSLRADTLPPAVDERPVKRFSRADAPFLTGLADRSFRFRRVYAGATYTYLAMPAMFRSEQPLESNHRGAPLGVLMAEQGRTPIAVVNDFFAQPIDDHMAQLLSGFALLRTYNERAQHEQRRLTLEALAQVKDQPFFAWLHYYGVHSPGWDGKSIRRVVRDWPKNYKRGLRWVDGEIRWLFQQLDRLGIAKRTVVVVTADHGEGLMDTGHMFHGPFVYEENIRVPLLIHMPGRPGRAIDETVGTIDIVPTLLQLTGGKSRFAHRGRSLVPLLEGKQSARDESYFFMSGSERQVGVARGADKHILDRKAQTHMRFDLDRDPLENENLFDERKRSHRALLTELVQQFPQIFDDQLRTGKVQRMLDGRLAAADPATPPGALPFLLRAIAARPNAERLAWARRVFAASGGDEIKLLVIDALHAADARGFGKLLQGHLAAIAGSAREPAFVDALADIGIGPFARAYVTRRFRAQLDHSREKWLPWLRLVCDWPHAGARDLEPLRILAERFALASGPRDDVALRILLRALAHAELRDLRDGPRADALVRWLDHPSLGIQADTARALGRTGIADAERLLRARLENRPLVVRLAALEGLTALLGDRALPLIRSMSAQYEVAATAVKLAASLGSPAALALLADLEQNAKSRFVRANARKARLALERPAVTAKPPA